MSVSKINNILALNVYTITGNELGELKNSHLNTRHIYDKYIPKYCLSDKGFIKDTETWLHWIEFGDEKYILIDIVYADPMLRIEFDNAGLEDTLKGLDLRPYLEYAPKLTVKDLHSVSNPFRLVIEQSYMGSDNREYGWELDRIDNQVIGYLDNETFELKKI